MKFSTNNSRTRYWLKLEKDLLACVEILQESFAFDICLAKVSPSFEYVITHGPVIFMPQQSIPLHKIVANHQENTYFVKMIQDKTEWVLAIRTRSPYAISVLNLMKLITETHLFLSQTKLIPQIEPHLDHVIELLLIVGYFTRNHLSITHNVANLIYQFVKWALYEDDKNILKDTFTDIDVLCLYISGLFHDIGKIAVSEDILHKKHKISPEHIEQIPIKLKIKIWEEFEQDLEAIPTDSLSHEKIQKILDEYKRKKIDCELYSEQITSALHRFNRGNIEKKSLLEEMAKLQSWITPIADPLSLLSEEEWKMLTNPIGTLNQEERSLIESHVSFSWILIKQLNWPPELSAIPEIILYHHEKMDGSGYPFGIKGDKIPLASQVLTITDMFEALISKERAYKEALSVESALEILKGESDKNRLRSDIFEAFSKFVRSYNRQYVENEIQQAS